MIKSPAQLTGWLLAVCSLGACGPLPDQAKVEQSAQASYEAAGKRDSGFAEPEALLETLKGFTEASDALRLLDLAYPRSQPEREAIKRLRERELARLALDQALRQQFPQDVDPTPDDLGIGDFARAIETSRIERTEGRRAYAPYRLDDGGQADIILVRYRESWWVAPETFSGGPRITDQWYFVRQTVLLNMPRVYNRLAEQVAGGEFASLAEAQRAIDEALQERHPPVGLVHSMPGTRPSKPRR